MPNDVLVLPSTLPTSLVLEALRHVADHEHEGLAIDDHFIRVVVEGLDPQEHE